GGAALAGLRRLVEQGWIDREERVGLFNTGSGLKYLDALPAALGQRRLPGPQRHRGRTTQATLALRLLIASSIAAFESNLYSSTCACAAICRSASSRRVTSSLVIGYVQCSSTRRRTAWRRSATSAASSAGMTARSCSMVSTPSSASCFALPTKPSLALRDQPTT